MPSQEGIYGSPSFLDLYVCSQMKMRVRTLVVRNSHSETKSSRFDSGCQVDVDVSSLAKLMSANVLVPVTRVEVVDSS